MLDNEKAEELLGFTVGELTVETYVGAVRPKATWGKHRYDYLYLCRCSCGKCQEFTRRVLIAKATVSRNTICCNDCKSSRLLGNQNGLKYDNDIDRHTAIVYSNYKSKCKKKGWDFELSFDQFKSFVTKDCWYCGLEPSNNRSRQTGGASYSRRSLSGIDRIDNSKGYVEGNCRTSCEDCNLAKRGLTTSQFLTMVQRIHARHLTTGS
jgi:hypothetical protein